LSSTFDKKEANELKNITSAAKNCGVCCTVAAIAIGANDKLGEFGAARNKSLLAQLEQAKKK